MSSAASTPASVGTDHQLRSNRTRPVPGHERPVPLVLGLGEVARGGDAQALGIGDEQRACRVRAAEPLLARHREKVDSLAC